MANTPTHRRLRRKPKPVHRPSKQAVDRLAHRRTERQKHEIEQRQARTAARAERRRILQQQNDEKERIAAEERKKEAMVSQIQGDIRVGGKIRIF